MIIVSFVVHNYGKIGRVVLLMGFRNPKQPPGMVLKPYN